MGIIPTNSRTMSRSGRYLAGLAVWACGWLILLLLHPLLSLGNLSLLLVLTSALAAVWLPLYATLLAGVLALMAFNWMFVPPIGTFAIDLQQDAVLLLVLLVVNVIIASILIALRKHADRAEKLALVANMLRNWSDTLRDTDVPHDCMPALQQMLVELSGSDTSLLLLKRGLPPEDSQEAVLQLGTTDAEQLAALWYSLRNGQSLGPHSGRYQELPDIYLPVRGKSMTRGAALLRSGEHLNSTLLTQAQTLCDQMGTALERYALQQQELETRQLMHEQELRATLLAAISHDYRTPLATILGAASALAEQADKLGNEQKQLLTRRIVAEATHLRKLTTNILQLARLDTPGMELVCDWEAAEEIIGSLVQRQHQAERRQRLQVRVERDLPLLWCDSLLLAQLLDNLSDNAFKYAPQLSPVQVSARCEGEWVILSVSDEGPGIPEALQTTLFAAFQRGQVLSAQARTPENEGVGIGLALCRVIAEAHGGMLRLVSTRGTCFECLLPVKTQPEQPANELVPGATAT